MKKCVSLLALFLIFLVGCSKSDDLTRIDIQRVMNDGSYGEEVTLTEVNILASFEKTMKEVKWNPNTKASMARKEDFLISAFYNVENNMPEKISEYRIWFNDDNSATIISNNEKEGFGSLDKANGTKLRSIINVDK